MRAKRLYLRPSYLIGLDYFTKIGSFRVNYFTLVEAACIPILSLTKKKTENLVLAVGYDLC